jgi:hypothetical protein
MRQVSTIGSVRNPVKRNRSEDKLHHKGSKNTKVRKNLLSSGLITVPFGAHLFLKLCVLCVFVVQFNL